MKILDVLKKKSKIECFTTPSHSQSFFILPKLRQFYKYDISETQVQDPQGALFSAQKNAAKIYKTKSTHFLINGSTSGIIAAILACVKKGEKVLIWDKAHNCHKNAVVLAGAEPVYYEFEFDKNWGIFISPKKNEIEEKLKKDKIKAVIVTSPTYEGAICDISQMSKICKKYGAYLIVDEAHGALYPFCDKLPKSAIYQGADFVIQSLHKTAGGLNPTALLHCNRVDVEIEEALSLITTTSPSYPLLASIEKNIYFLNSNRGRRKILELVENIENIKKNLDKWEFFEGDTTKILAKHPTLKGIEVSQILFDKYKIEDEIVNENSVMFLTGIGTDLKKLKKLESALKQLSK